MVELFSSSDSIWNSFNCAFICWILMQYVYIILDCGECAESYKTRKIRSNWSDCGRKTTGTQAIWNGHIVTEHYENVSQTLDSVNRDFTRWIKSNRDIQNVCRQIVFTVVKMWQISLLLSDVAYENASDFDTNQYLFCMHAHCTLQYGDLYPFSNAIFQCAATMHKHSKNFVINFAFCLHT